MRGEKMLNLTKITVLLIVLFGGTSIFAQPQDAQVINAEFKKMDINHDNFVTPDEMQAYQAKTFQELDKDKNNVIDAEELVADQTDMHKLADKNQDGKVTQDESISQFNEYFKQMDQNQDGKISEAEYTDYWKLIYKY
jgi:Ca2+-binding EF-hand superfamily protein